MFLNWKEFKIDSFIYLISDQEYKNISSTKVRKLALDMELEKLYKFVSPLIISNLLEKVLKIKNIFMVVGRPGSGKTTFLNYLNQIDQNNTVINTDEFNKRLKGQLENHFKEKDLIKCALNNEEELKRIIKKPWISLLKESLNKSTKNSNIFVEIAYGLQADKQMFNFVGGKIIYFDCDKKNKQRNILRKTPELIPFIKKIPNQKQTKIIAQNNILNLTTINTNCSLQILKQKAVLFNKTLKGEIKWKTSL
jgi:dephospho-CoA kinase